MRNTVWPLPSILEKPVQTGVTDVNPETEKDVQAAPSLPWTPVAAPHWIPENRELCH